MSNIESFVFFDIETTGLPWQERNQTKITELSFVATSRNDLISTAYGDSPPVSKLTIVFNPKRPIHPEATQLNGLSNDLLKHAPLFSHKSDTLLSFLQELPKPVCLVAHNGNKFDYKIFLAECQEAKFQLPNDLLCIDSLIGFRKIYSDRNKIITTVECKVTSKQNVEDLLTDDEDEWPNLNVSNEEWDSIDKISESFSDIMSCEDVSEVKENQKIDKKKKVDRSKIIKDVFKKTNKNKTNEGFSLLALYKRLLNKEPTNHHRAEDDCLMLLHCVVAAKEDFIPWADKSCIKLAEIKPLNRY